MLPLGKWCGREDSNLRSARYQLAALAAELPPHVQGPAGNRKSRLEPTGWTPIIVITEKTLMMIQNASRDIKRLREEGLRRRWEREHLSLIVHSIDDLLFHLEELNLQGVPRVPASLRERAAQILDLLPGENEELRVRQRIGPMMDVLFRAQDVIFRLRDPHRPREDEEDSLSDASA